MAAEGRAFQGNRSMKADETSPISHVLDHTRKQIRLLQFQGSEEALEGESTLSFKFVIRSLADDSPARYFAVSYAWGDNPAQAEILLDGRKAVVPGSAEQAFRGVLNGLQQTGRHLRCPIWIDAICINQSDPMEKAEQIEMMKDIYADAESVVIWLGSDDGTTAAALAAMRLLWTDRAALGVSEDELLQKPGSKAWFADPQKLPYWSTPPPTGCDWKAIDSVLRSRWFSRLWIVQELAHAKKVVCFRGSHAVPWDVFMPIVHWIRVRQFEECVSIIEDFEPRMESINRLIQLREHSDPMDQKFSSLLLLNIQFHASNPWDRVYALLSLRDPIEVAKAQAEQNGMIEVDYTRPLKNVYAQASYVAMVGSRSLEVLSLLPAAVCPLKPPRRHDSWPSWVPRYDQVAENLQNVEGVHELFYHYVPGKPQICGYSVDGNVLHIKGICIGRVAFVWDLSPLKDINHVDLDEKMAYRCLARSWFLEATSPDETALGDFEKLVTALKSRQKSDLLLRKRAWRTMDLAALLRKVAEESDWGSLADIQPVLALAGSNEGSEVELTTTFQDLVAQLGLYSLVVLETGSIGFCAGDVRPGDQVGGFFSGEYFYAMRRRGDNHKICGFAGGLDFEKYERALRDEGRLEAEARTFHIN